MHGTVASKNPGKLAPSGIKTISIGAAVTARVMYSIQIARLTRSGAKSLSINDSLVVGTVSSAGGDADVSVPFHANLG